MNFCEYDKLPVFMAATPEFIEENPEAVEKFVEDWATVTNWVRDPANRDAVIDVTSQVMQIPREVLNTYLLTEQDFLRPENGAISLGALQEEWDFFRERGGIQQDLTVTDYLTDLSVTDEGGG